MTKDILTTPIPSKGLIVLIATMMSIVALSIDAILPALGMVGEDLKIANPNQAQFIISMIFAGMAIGQLFNGPLSDAIGRKKVLFIGLSIYTVGSLICATAQTIEIMLLGRFIQGFGAAGSQITAISVIRDKFSGRTMARVFSLVMMIFIMVPTIAPTIGQAILYIGSWHNIFIFYIAYACLVMIWAYFKLDETLPAEKRIPFNFKNITNGIKTVFTTRSTVFYTIAMGCSFGCFLSYLSSCQQIFQVQFGVGDMFVVFFGLQAIALGVASFTNSRLVERLGMRAICFRALSAASLVSLAFLGLHFAIEIQFWMFFIYTVIILFNFGLIFGNLNSLALEPMGEIVGIAAALTNASSTVISITLATLIGQLYNGSLIPIVSGFFGLTIMAMVFMRLAEKKT